MMEWIAADQTELAQFFNTPPPLVEPRSEQLKRPSDSPTPRALEDPPPKTERPISSDYLVSEDSSYAEEAASSTRPASQRRPYEIDSGRIKPLKGIAAHASVAVLVFVLVSVVTIIADTASISFINTALNGRFDDEYELNRQADLVDSFAQLSALVYLAIFAWSAVVIGRWTHRAMKNLREMGHETTVSPGWTWGWHFIPFALWWMPFKGMAEIWRGSVHGAPSGNAGLPGSMRIWWATWLIGNVLSFAAFRMQETGMEIENFELVQASMGIGIVGSGLHIVSAILLVGLMKQVTIVQDAKPALEFT